MLAYNEATGELAFYPIEVVWVNLDPVIVHLTINGETIETTPEHPFYTEAGEWVYAGSLLPGDEIRTAAWGVGTVEAIHFTLTPQTMYNLTVATAHTYFVGDGQWLVHNCNLSYTSEINAGTQQWERFAETGGKQFRFNTGHGFYRTHTGPGGVITDLRTTTLTADFVEGSIANDLIAFGNSGGLIPGNTTLERTITLENLNITYRAITLSNGTISISTYFISP